MFQNLNFDNELWEFITSTTGMSRISDILRHNDVALFKLEGDFIKVDEIDTISFVPKSKLSMCNGFSEEKFRTKIKVGRFVKKFFKKETLQMFYINDSQIEEFVNLFKSYFDNDLSKFKIVSGKEIKKWYHVDNYFTPNGCRRGTLWNSCMRYPEKNSYMNIYAENPEVIKMLVNIDETGTVKSRALLWESAQDENGNTYKVMDRIYSVYEHEVTSFKKWAVENGYIYKYEQSAKSERLFVTPSGVKEILLKVKLDNWKLRKYPYIDTFKFLNFSDGVLSNNDNFRYDFILVQNDGELERIDEPEPEPDEGW
jgi:hypothetical protein